jgi:hypothetical protein
MPHWRPIDKRFGSGQRAASLPRWIERSTARAGAYECKRDDDLRWMTLDSRDSSPGSIVRIARPLERRTIPFAGRLYIFCLQASPPNILGLPGPHPTKFAPSGASPPMTAYTGGSLMFTSQLKEACTLLTILLIIMIYIPTGAFNTQ